MTIPTRSHRLTAVIVLAAALVGGCQSTPTADRPDAFDAEFAAGIDRSPTPDTLYSMGRLLAARNRDDQAYFVFKRLIDEHPDFVPAYNDMAELLMRHDKLDLARAYLTHGLDISPKDPVLVNNLGMCHMLRGEHENALAFFTQAHELRPDHDRYRTNMATTNGLMGRYDEALALYEKTMELADAHHNVAVLAEARDDAERAKQEFAAADRLRKR